MQVDWLIGTRFARQATAPDCPTIRKELERLGLVVRRPGAGGFEARGPSLDEARESLFGVTTDEHEAAAATASAPAAHAAPELN